jgi:glyoxylate reductase
MGKIFITRKIPDAGLKLLRKSRHKVLVWPEDRVIPRDILLKRISGCDAVLTMLTERVDARFIGAAGKNLKIVANMAVGFDNFDMKALADNRVMATNTPGVLTEAVAEHTFALLMAIARRVTESERFLRAGKYRGWEPLLLLGTQLEGKTLGVIGLGRIGISVARMAQKGLGMNIAYHDVARNAEFEGDFDAEFCSLPDILKKSDFISIHVPLLPSTRHLIGAAELKKMKRTAYLINTARGPIIDERAMVSALKRKLIAGAALDVFEKEPALTPGLAKLDNVIITPHIASATREARDAMALMAAKGILDALSKKVPLNLIS